MLGWRPGSGGRTKPPSPPSSAPGIPQVSSWPFEEHHCCFWCRSELFTADEILPPECLKNTARLVGTFVLLDVRLCPSWRSPRRAGSLLQGPPRPCSPAGPPRLSHSPCCTPSPACPQTPQSSVPWTSLQSPGQGGGPWPRHVRPPPASLCPCPGHGCTPTRLTPPSGETQATPQAGAVVSKGHVARVWGEGSGPTVPACFSGASPGVLRGAGNLALSPSTQKSKDVNPAGDTEPQVSDPADGDGTGSDECPWEKLTPLETSM